MIDYEQKALDKCIEKYGDKYEYLGSYTKNKRRIMICYCHEKDENGNEHGMFEVNYQKHISRGDGCPKCSTHQKVSLERAEKEGKLFKPNNFDYLDIIYQNGKPFIKLYCHEKDENGNEHGEFLVNFHKHIHRGDGCPKCRYISSGKAQAISNEEFVSRVKKIHSDEENYTILTQYKNTHEKVDICCHIKDENGNEHGIFSIIPLNIYGKYGNEWCPKCGILKNSENRTYSIEKWINLAKEKHNNKYIYDENLNYTNSSSIVNILCPKHGYFSMVARNHLYGQGCPICNESKLEKEIAKFLDDNNIQYNRQQRFKWLGRQSLDFYLPQHNIAIECQGKQHFGLGGWSKDEFNLTKEYEHIKELDDKKKKLCENNDIKLLYYSNLKIEYPYKVFEDKNELLNEIKTK